MRGQNPKKFYHKSTQKITLQKNLNFFFLFYNTFKLILKWFWESKKILDFFFIFFLGGESADHPGVNSTLTRLRIGGTHDFCTEIWLFWWFLKTFPVTYEHYLWGFCSTHQYSKTPTDGVHRSPGRFSKMTKQRPLIRSPGAVVSDTTAKNVTHDIFKS